MILPSSLVYSLKEQPGPVQTCSRLNAPSKLVCCLSKGGPIGLQRARFDAHRPQFNYTINPVWALGEHRRPTGPTLIPFVSTELTRLIPPSSTGDKPSR